eukprot:15455848-Alexandrium_andersonii.AAC.1
MFPSFPALVHSNANPLVSKRAHQPVYPKIQKHARKQEGAQGNSQGHGSAPRMATITISHGPCRLQVWPCDPDRGSSGGDRLHRCMCAQARAHKYKHKYTH